MTKHLKFIQTCIACPEQYDVILNKEQVAYVRLRWGHLVVYYPDYLRGVLIYEHSFGEKLKGEFTDAERDYYLDIIRRKIVEKLEEQK